ncbi:MAG: zinc-ribbon and DUF3426 domain-containing protein [Gammaproteobacteria bacterium]
MYTQCPECGQNQILGVDELREGRGMIRCSNCSTIFDALQRLSETPPVEAPTAVVTELPWTPQLQLASGFWRLTLALSLITLTGQMLYFEAPKALQSATLRPWFEKACSLLQCELPSYRKLDDFAIVHSELTPSGDNHLVFQASIHNQAEFQQRLPDLKLTFMNLTGEHFAQRIFSPDQYKATSSNFIGPDQPFEISLDIAPSNTAVIGGYTFELI